MHDDVSMRPRLALPLIVILAAALTGCDLVSDPDGPSPEDFEVEQDTSEVISNDDRTAHEVRVRQDVAAPLSTARGDVTLSIKAPR